MERFDQAGAELAPVVAAVARLHVERADPGAVGAGDDAGDAAALGAVDVPDPHALTVEGRRPGGGAVVCPAPPGIAQAAMGMYAVSAIREKIAKSTRRHPIAVVRLAFTSTGNTVAGMALRLGKSIGRAMYLISPVNIQAIRSPRKILCIAARRWRLAGARAAPAAAEAPRPELLRAELSQAGQSLILSLRTSAPAALSRLDRLPAASGSRYLCLALRPAGPAESGASAWAGRRMRAAAPGLELLDAGRKVTAQRTLAAQVKRPNAHKLVLVALTHRTPG